MIPPSLASIDPAHFRKVLGHFASGITIITGMEGDEPVGMTAQSFMSVSLDPPLVAICPAKSSSSWPRIRGTQAFCINILGDAQEDMCRVFAMSGTDKFRGIGWRLETSGSPVLDGVIGWIGCRIHAEHDAGDHTIVVGRVLGLHSKDEPGGPLLFYRGGYGSLCT